MGKQLTVNSANAHFMPTKSKQTARLSPGPSKSLNPENWQTRTQRHSSICEKFPNKLICE